ncbi:MAG: hypothetical protein JXR76_24020 [Deltaproteobacteria bacterium]|nr:hypothetical protein [Deltaproteobacteria bacterium]
MKQNSEQKTVFLLLMALLMWTAVNFTISPATVMAAEVKSDDSASSVSEENKHRYRNHWKKKSTSSFYIMGGVANIDMDALNGRLVRNGYDKIESLVIPMGFGFNHRFNRFIAGIDWQFLMHNMPQPPDENLRMDVRHWYWQLNYGVDFLQLDNLSIYALLGLGVGHSGIWISEESGDSFNGVLREPLRSTYMRQNSFVISGNIGVDYRMEMRKTERRTSYFTIGIRGGYVFTPFAGDWRTHAAEIHNGPSRGFNGPAVLLAVGMTRKHHPEQPAVRK